MKTFEQIYQLRERYIPIKDLNLEDYDNLESVELKDKLENIKRKPSWDFLMSGENALEVLHKFSRYSLGGNRSFLILSENNPVGIIDFEIKIHALSNKEYVDEIMLLGFKENSITLVKDTFVLMKKMLEEYGLMMWSVDANNPIKKAYDKKVTEWGGEITPRRDGKTIFYRLEKDKVNLIESKQTSNEAWWIDPTGIIYDIGSSSHILWMRRNYKLFNLTIKERTYIDKEFEKGNTDSWDLMTLGVEKNWVRVRNHKYDNFNFTVKKLDRKNKKLILDFILENIQLLKRKRDIIIEELSNEEIEQIDLNEILEKW